LASLPPVQCQKLRSVAADNLLDMCSPELRGYPLFRREVVPLVNTDDAAEGAGAVVQQFLDRRQVDTEPRQTTGSTSPQVVQSPRRHVRGQQRIKLTLLFVLE
jgi:hypothetical protein